MNHKKLVVIGFIALAILTLLMVVDYQKKKGADNQSVSPNILSLTQPVTSLSGVVEKIEGNRLFINKKIIYQVVVSDKTQIYQPASISYLFKTISGTPPKLTIKDVRVGQHITLDTQTDLRTFTGTIFEATTINLPPKTNMVKGIITRLDGNTLILKAVPSASTSPYTFIITPDTEISHYVNNVSTVPGVMPMPPTLPEKLSISDLKKDMQVTVYTNTDVTTSTKGNALRIEPVVDR